MQSLTTKKSEITITLNTEDMTAEQVRILKAMSALMTNVLTSDEESEYFEASAQLMKKAAELIRKSHYAHDHKQIPYGEQALEYAVDFLNDALNGSEFIDN
jgi:hypothetical protein